MSQPPTKNVWEGDKILNIYIYDYCLKRNWTAAAQAILNEAQVPQDSTVPIDSPHGFLYEWWVVFWDIFSARTNKTGSKDAQTFIERQNLKPESSQFNQLQTQKAPGQPTQQPGQNLPVGVQNQQSSTSQVGGPQNQTNSVSNPNINSLRLNLTAKPNSPVINNPSQVNPNANGPGAANAFSPPQTNAQLPGNAMGIGENNGMHNQVPGQTIPGQNPQMQAGMRGGVNPVIVQQIMQTLGLAGRDPSTLNNNEKQAILSVMKRPEIQHQIAAQMQRPGGNMQGVPGMGGMTAAQMAQAKNAQMAMQQQQGGQPGIWSSNIWHIEVYINSP
ncbi:hypothetical protein K7432_005345 [Basidiobolus ranarum]|uniref:LisH domain-containing protein n=1 Tax=Basidiobolus ranarum TaxID=34480 RepID=A0ABR2WWQ0_9FUNG